MDGENRQDAATQAEETKAATAEPAGTAAASAQEADGAKSYDEAYVSKLRADFEKQKADAVAEAVKKEKMSAEDKAKYEADRREQEIAKREREIALRELKADAEEMLAKERLSGSFVDMVIGADAEATKENIKTLKAAIDAQVQLQVEARLKGTTPKTGSGAGDKGSDTGDMEAQMNKIMGL
ncbi:MAG: DUF4355 domain-containing protein [Lachnospiraceae bacterium]|nr:DUF4355 domain-containing protein [Lachnospiraceae bacterium]